LSLRKLKGDSISIVANNDNVFHVRIDKAGRVLGVLPIAGTASSRFRPREAGLDA